MIVYALVSVEKNVLAEFAVEIGTLIGSDVVDDEGNRVSHAAVLFVPVFFHLLSIRSFPHQPRATFPPSPESSCRKSLIRTAR
jgi:hypothetical protein